MDESKPIDKLLHEIQCVAYVQGMLAISNVSALLIIVVPLTQSRLRLRFFMITVSFFEDFAAKRWLTLLAVTTFDLEVSTMATSTDNIISHLC